MTKPDILFYQSCAFQYFGVVALNSHIKEAGFTTDLVIDELETDPIGKLKKINPAVIGFSVMSADHRWLVNLAWTIKKEMPDVFMIAGGIHGMLYWENILKETPIDLVCHSDGEDVLLKVLERLKTGTNDWADIPGLAYRNTEGDIVSNERAELTRLSDEAIDDYSIYFDKYPQLVGRYGATHFFSSRGCPYRCSFCYNATIHKIFQGKGTFLRQKKALTFVREIKTVAEKYGIKKVQFYDDLFIYNKEWLCEFLDEYKKQINLPFICAARANLMTPDIARSLADAGCLTVSFGVETGNPKLREKVLNKPITDEQIIKCGRAISEYGMRVHTTNMYCIPEETVNDSFLTVELNQRSRATITANHFFMPFPETPIAEYCKQKGYVPQDYSLKDTGTSMLRSSVMSVHEKTVMANIHDASYFFIKWPRLYKLLRWTVYVKSFRPLFVVIYNLSDFCSHMEQKDASFFGTFVFYLKRIVEKRRMDTFNRQRSANVSVAGGIHA